MIAIFIYFWAVTTVESLDDHKWQYKVKSKPCYKARCEGQGKYIWLSFHPTYDNFQLKVSCPISFVWTCAFCYLVDVFHKIDDSGTVGNKGLPREEQNKLSKKRPYSGD